jgi:glycosyltransferase involved in cell wall biosynthesis
MPHQAIDKTMTNIRLVANSVVRNEECWFWYSLKSVLPYVQEILVWDTGSKDHTVSIVKSIRSPKIKFKCVSPTFDETALSRTRQRMLQATRADWLMILDGDEVWPESSLQKIIAFINTEGEKYDSIVVPTLNCVGDIYHICSPKTGRYKIAGHVGHYNIRFINLSRIKGLHVANLPGKLQSYYDARNVKIQDRNPKRIAFLEAPLMHMTHLKRSHYRKNEVSVYWRGVKKRFELGVPLASDFKYPSVFDLNPPLGSIYPWQHRALDFYIAAHLMSPLRNLKHLLM